MIDPQTIEKCMLGLLLDNPKVMGEVGDLDLADFALDSHRHLLTIIRNLYMEGMEVNLLTLVSELQRRNEMDVVGGAGYVASLTDDAHLMNDARSYVRILKGETKRRQLLALCEVAAARARQGEDADTVLQDLQSGALATQAAGAIVKAQHISELVTPTWEALSAEMEAKGPTLGIPTGIPILDATLGGWRPAELAYVGGLPNRGKTPFALQCMHHAAAKGFGVGVISLEMRSQALMRRLTTIHSGLHAFKLRDPREMSASDRAHAFRSITALGDLPIWFCDQPGLRPNAVASLMRQMHAKGAKAIFIDYLQLIDGQGRDEREAINKVSTSIRDTCKALNISVIALSQLKRRDNDIERPPTLRDLKESSNLEQDCDVCLMIHRPKVDGRYTGNDQIIVEKQREGATGPCDVTFDTRTLTFVDRRPSLADRAA